MDFTGKPLRGFVYVSPPGFRTLAALRGLRIEQGGDLRESQVFRDRHALETRSQAVYDVLVEKG
jgi:hypothetical protein